MTPDIAAVVAASRAKPASRPAPVRMDSLSDAQRNFVRSLLRAQQAAEEDRAKVGA